MAIPPRNSLPGLQPYDWQEWNPDSSTAFPTMPNNQNRPFSALISESDPEPETETIRDLRVYLHGICVFILPRQDGPKNFHIQFLIFSVFAILCAVMYDTYPGTSTRYTGSSSIVYLAGFVELNNSLLEMAKYGPTILPVLFACIVGSALRLIGRWKAERGVAVTVSNSSLL
jgi:hypothetical protein